VFEKDVDDPNLIVYHHRETYRDRLKSTKERLQWLEVSVQELQRELEVLQRERVEREAELMLKLNWETRSRIAQALNDEQVSNLSQDVFDSYVRLKEKGYIYLPYVLSMWAISTNREPATLFDLDDETKGKFIFSAEALHQFEGLEACIEHIWEAIPTLERNIMIIMFSTRSSDRTTLAHPTPTVDQGRFFIGNDPHLSPFEKIFIHDFIPNAKDKQNNPLFVKVEDVVMRTE
jgi:hypothetical protein